MVSLLKLSDLYYNIYIFKLFKHWDLTTVFNVIDFVECFKRAGLPNDCELLFRNPSSIRSIDVEVNACLKRNNETPQLFRKIIDECAPTKA